MHVIVLACCQFVTQQWEVPQVHQEIVIMYVFLLTQCYI